MKQRIRQEVERGNKSEEFQKEKLSSSVVYSVRLTFKRTIQHNTLH